MNPSVPADDALDAMARNVAERAAAAGILIATAESCTGGWVAKILTDIPGSSAWFERGFVTYSNRSKQEMLGVRGATLGCHGAVSEQTVREMAQGALNNSGAGLALATSGIAGPGGATPGKPLGTVCFAWARRDGEVITRRERFPGGREAVRRQAVAFALNGALALMTPPAAD